MKIIDAAKYLSDIKYLKNKSHCVKIDKDLKPVLDAIQNGSSNGTAIKDIGKEYGGNLFKVRIPNSTAKKGKYKGFKLIYDILTMQETRYMKIS